MDNLLNFEFKVNPSICDFEGDNGQLYKAFKLQDGGYLIRWDTKNGKSEIEYTSEEVKEEFALGNWIIKY